MATDAPTARPAIHVGRYDVQATKADIARFTAALADETVLDQDIEAVPVSFPMMWLGRADISAALKAVAMRWATPDTHVLIHLVQTVSVSTPLAIDTPYSLAVEVSPPDENGAIRIDARVIDAAEVEYASLSGEIALVPIEALK